VPSTTTWRVLRARRIEAWALRLGPATAALVSGELVLALALLR
jgi:hypothetical protein